MSHLHQVLFLDTEFTGLHQSASLISIALVAQNGKEFYAEFTDYDKSQLNEWLRENVLPRLTLENGTEMAYPHQTLIRGSKREIREALESWLAQFESVEVWADVPAYDWILFCELFGGAVQIPNQIFYAPFDLATVFRIKGLIEPETKYEKDISRYEFAGVDMSRQHHALTDARVQRVCYQRLLQL